MRRAALALTLLALLPAGAAAQDPAAVPGAAAAPPPAAPVAGKLALTAERVGPDRAVLAGTSWRVRGVLTPYVAGQKATVRFYRGRSKVKVQTVSLLPSVSGKSGAFVVSFTTTTPGRVVVRASHLATPELATTVAAPAAVDVLPLRASPGSKGPAVRFLQQRLARLGYVVGAPGLFDGRTARAVTALRKNLGMARTTVADRSVFAALAAGRGAFAVRFPKHGRHIEADISKQVLALIGADGKVERIYPTSGGAPATPTILGSFRVYRKDPGTNELGMVHSSYFIRGFAIHGFASVPVFGASHGCLRVPVPDALSIFNWVRGGTRVDTYR